MSSEKNKAENILIKGARMHNLKNIDVTIPRNKFVVITGVSGSGKSTLAFETLYAEGQRRYIESLSAYARQFLKRMDKPDVDFIKGIPPAIAIEQKVNIHNSRSTVGTSTEIYDYLKLLYARIGKTISPVSGSEVKRHSIKDVLSYIFLLDENAEVAVLAPVRNHNGRKTKVQLEVLLQQGFTRIENREKILKIREIISGKKKLYEKINLLIDRVRVKKEDDDFRNRLADSVQTAFYEGNGDCYIRTEKNGRQHIKPFSNRFEEDGFTFNIPTENTFSFNNPLGACSLCEGFGKILGIDPELVIPNKNLSVYEEAVVCWRGEKMKKWKDRLIRNAHLFDFPVHKPYFQLSDEHKNLLWKGNRYFRGIHSFFKYVRKKQYKIQYRIMLARYRGKTLCSECGGTRLKKEAGYVKINEKSLPELVDLQIDKLLLFFKKIQLKEYEKKVGKRILFEICSRLQFLIDVGLGYLTLNRLSSSLSGGENQRINLATSVGSSLVGSLYILDEPSIGLHPKDTKRLISVLKDLQKLGNTVLVVEHDEEIINASDEIIDIGPNAGRFGGEVVFQGNGVKLKQSTSLTAKYITGKMKIPLPQKRRNWNNYIEIIGARENNLKNITVKFPLNVMTVIAGVSGSGKSSLLHNIFYPAVRKYHGKYSIRTGDFDTIRGDINRISDIEYVDQNPIGRSSRSNPVTYLKIYDDIRKLFSVQQASKQLGFKPSHFSFNVDGGRCDECKGEGEIKVEMQFMADIRLICDHCKGKRFKDNVLSIGYKNKNIFDVLEMSISEAIEFFGEKQKKITNKLQVLVDVGLEYLKLGQSSSTLSGGESQRVKLAYFLSKEKANPNVFIFDEPTTGLHFHDINKLLKAFGKLIENGHTILIIEHNLEVIKSADWVIDLGPEGGKKGGEVLFEGTPEDLVRNKNSYTAEYLKNKILNDFV